MLPSLAYKVNKNHTIGASIAIGVQQFRAYGLGAFEDLGFAGPGATKTSGNGNDWSYGAGIRLGWMGKFFDKRLTLGTNYASRVYMTEFDKKRDIELDRVAELMEDCVEAPEEILKKTMKDFATLYFKNRKKCKTMGCFI